LTISTPLADLGRLDEAESCLNSIVSKTQAHSDLLHLGSAHLNRASLWFSRQDVVRLFEDLRAAVQIAREIGDPLLEYPAAVNMAEVNYAIVRLDEANEHTVRGLELAKQLWGPGSLELGTRELLLARIALFRGQLSRADELARSVRARLRQNEAGALDFLRSDQAVLEMIELSAREASESEWEEFAARVREIALPPLDETEIMEGRALAAHRAGRIDVSRALFRRTLELCVEKPTLLTERVQQTFARLFPDAAN
jgi:hypothetical protein